MTNIELAERIIDDVARAVQSGEWTGIRPLAVFSLASAFEVVAQAAYENGYCKGCLDEDVSLKMSADYENWYERTERNRNDIQDDIDADPSF